MQRGDVVPFFTIQDLPLEIATAFHEVDQPNKLPAGEVD
jgi:hypothetical protein